MAHILSSFDEDFTQINATIAQLGGIAEAQLLEVTDYLEKRKVDGLDALIARDKELDKLDQDLHEQAIRLIALRAPMAQDLRRVVVALKVASSLERIGDYSKNIAKRSKVVIPAQLDGAPMASLIRMSGMVQEMLHSVMDAYMEMDANLADEIRARDLEVDKLHTSLFKSLLEAITEQPDKVAIGSHLLFIAKNIERIGDYATNIAEQVYFLVHGEFPSDERQKADTSSLTQDD
ncbi:phosphate signaling complex protein PhoU [Alphaproteobacteria bacterium]|nr:phosphate signaling complex protein PhoU [Alphaproteobacteria bacterium]